MRRKDEIEEILKKITDDIETQKGGKAYFQKFGDTADYVLTWIHEVAGHRLYHRKVISRIELDTIIDPDAILRSFLSDVRTWEAANYDSLSAV